MAPADPRDVVGEGEAGEDGDGDEKAAEGHSFAP
jgi:hypothetical protein